MSPLRIVSKIEPPCPAPTGNMAPPTKANGAGLAAAADESSPVLAQLQKRIRNLRKRLRNCEDIEAKKEAGKELNADQVGLLPDWSGQTHLAVCKIRIKSPKGGQSKQGVPHAHADL